MTHFFSNPLSILLIGDSNITYQSQHFQACRNVRSFRQHIERLVNTGQVEQARRLLEDDEAHLHDQVNDMLASGQDAMEGLLDAIRLIEGIEAQVTPRTSLPWSELYIQATSGKLIESTLLRELLMTISKLPSDSMVGLLETWPPDLGLSEQLTSIKSLIGRLDFRRGPLRAENDESLLKVKTTVVAQSVQLRHHKSAMSEEDSEYSDLVKKVHIRLKEYLESKLIDPKKLPLHEVFLFDLKSPCADVFAPMPHFIIDRALKSPHDYLACESCDKTDVLSPDQPATTILYQLYLESGAIINTSDLWSAFHEILAPNVDEEADVEVEDEEQEEAIL